MFENAAKIYQIIKYICFGPAILSSKNKKKKKKFITLYMETKRIIKTLIILSVKALHLEMFLFFALSFSLLPSDYFL